MDRDSSFGESGSSLALLGSPAPAPTPRKLLPFLRDDGSSLLEMAERDLEATLQLLAERAQYITGATAAAIALSQGKEMICQASAGPAAPELGVRLEVNSGLTAESVRTRQVLRCDDTETDPRVDRESCRALGIKSVMVTPLIREQEVVGVFELLADRTHAFEERDLAALQRLSEMVFTALEHADAARHLLPEMAVSESETQSEPAARGEIQNPAAVVVPSPNAPESGSVSDCSVEQPELVRELRALRKCELCGFPVSANRALCLDCEEARRSQEDHAPIGSNRVPAFLAQLAMADRGEGWLQSHRYIIGTLLVVALTVVLIVFKLSGH